MSFPINLVLTRIFSHAGRRVLSLQENRRHADFSQTLKLIRLYLIIIFFFILPSLSVQSHHRFHFDSSRLAVSTIRRQRRRR